MKTVDDIKEEIRKFDENQKRVSIIKRLIEMISSLERTDWISSHAINLISPNGTTVATVNIDGEIGISVDLFSRLLIDEANRLTEDIKKSFTEDF